jgi:MFS transporter, DHA3 family, macrolide efflux protein
MDSSMANETRRSLKPFYLMWLSQAVSLFGSQLVQFALIWWLTQETGSATVLAVASLVGLLPQVVLGPFVGALVDRWNRRLTMMAADGLVALATLLLALLFWTGVVQIWHIYVLMFVRALAGSFHWPAMNASTTLMVPENHLARIQGLNQTVNGALNIVSAPLGALLLGVLPVQGVLAIDVVTAALAITLLLFIRIPQPAARQRSEADPVESGVRNSYWSDLREGLRYVWGWPGLVMLLAMAALINFMLNPGFALLPLVVTNHFQGGALQLGWLESAVGVGIMAGGLLLGVWGGFKRRIVTSQAGLITLGLAVLLFGFVPASAFTLAVVLMFVLGAALPITNGPLQAVVQVVVAPDMQGRVFGLASSISGAMTPVGLILAGPLADLIGVRSWYVGAGIVTILMGVTAFFIPAIMHLEDRTWSGGEQPVIEAAARLEDDAAALAA